MAAQILNPTKQQIDMKPSRGIINGKVRTFFGLGSLIFTLIHARFTIAKIIRTIKLVACARRERSNQSARISMIRTTSIVAMIGV